MSFYVKGKKLVDDSIVNVNRSLVKKESIDQNNSLTDIMNNSVTGPTLQAFRDGDMASNNDGITSGNYGSGIIFGNRGTKGVLSIAAFDKVARVAGGDDKTTWHEDLAFKSDITRLEQKIQQLEKQIGGVIKSLYSKLSSRFSLRKAVA